MRQFFRVLVGLFFVLPLMGCSSLSLGTALQLQAIDYLNDDIASLIFALDLPQTVKPVPDSSYFTFEMTTAGFGERRIKAVLQRADTDDISGELPAIGNGRSFHLYKLSEDDRAKLREAQAFARDLKTKHDNVGGQLSIGIVPALCSTTELKPENTRFSVQVTLPGKTRLQPLINNQKLSELLEANTGLNLEMCEA